VEDYTDEWMDNATTFLDHAFLLSKIVQCPCSRCQNTRCMEDKTTIVIHFCKNGFVPGYEVWKFHGDSSTRVITKDEHDCDGGLIGWTRCLELYKQRLLRILLQWRWRHFQASQSFRRATT
jgi:hypothetical protein